MKIFNHIDKKIGVSGSIIISGILISLSIFFTAYIFFGGANNRNRSLMNSPVRNVPTNNPLIQRQFISSSTISTMPVGTTSTTTNPKPAPIKTKTRVK